MQTYHQATYGLLYRYTAIYKLSPEPHLYFNYFVATRKISLLRQKKKQNIKYSTTGKTAVIPLNDSTGPSS